MGDHPSNLEGTLRDYFQVGKDGPQFRRVATHLELRNALDNDLAQLRVSSPTHPDAAATLSDVQSASDSVLPNSIQLGSLLDYRRSANVSAGVIQYTQVRLVEDQSFNELGTFITAGGNGTREIKFGIYDQADPSDFEGVPRDRVAQTIEAAPANNNEYFIQLIDGGSFVVPTTGFYWLALIQDNAGLKINVTEGTYFLNYVPQYFETSTGTTLPLTASGLSRSGTRVALVFARYE